MNHQAVPLQHRGGGFKARRGMFADGTKNDAFGLMEEGERVMGGAGRLARAVPRDQHGLTNVDGPLHR